ncbi:hypothetical protein N7486_003529 [Penicillium sp. IBT 16267x]|nr:hypothetical protein N7486_003529 [Penicillium sp. IBT 16267x]
MSTTLGRGVPAEKPTKPLILLCDGTWCGRETETETNIYKLAERVGVNFQDDVAVHQSLTGFATLKAYVFNGITAQDIARQCIEVYEFIVKSYTYPDHEIWMFGLSRGAYLVRAVAGDEDPANPRALRFIPPIKFMGLFDTVGSLGLPDFTGGVGLEWPAFYDQNISTAVENVYHAVSLHDRIYAFQPCLDVTNNIRDRPHQVGNGDVYGHILYYAPFGSFILDTMRALRGTRANISAIYQLFFNLRDRFIPDQDATVYDFRSFDLDIGGSIKDLGEIFERRYPSKLYEKWELLQ